MTLNPLHSRSLLSGCLALLAASILPIWWWKPHPHVRAGSPKGMPCCSLWQLAEAMQYDTRWMEDGELIRVSPAELIWDNRENLALATAVLLVGAIMGRLIYRRCWGDPAPRA